MRVYVEEGGSKEVKLYGYPDVDHNLMTTSIALGPMQTRRMGIQLGF